jgi:hypothetical protein
MNWKQSGEVQALGLPIPRRSKVCRGEKVRESFSLEGGVSESEVIRQALAREFRGAVLIKTRLK